MPKEKIEKLLELTKLQEIALSNENMEAFNTLLNEREQVIEALKRLQQTYPEIKEQYNQEMMMKIREIDSNNHVNFNKQFEEAKKKLKEIREMKKRERHYNNQYDISWEEGIFFDKKEYR